jgi:hypothetical protein
LLIKCAKYSHRTLISPVQHNHDLLLVLEVVTDSKMLDVLNKRGAFIKKFCVERIHGAGWEVEEEFPVSVEFSTKQGSETYESVGDIRATLLNQSEDYNLIAVIECKQRFKPQWAFLTATVRHGTPKLLDLQYAYQSDLSRKASDSSSVFYYADLRVKEISDCMLCNYGVEHPPEPRPDKKFDSIYEACREVSLATRSSAEELRDEMESYGLSGTIPTHNVYIPIVMTSATVEICDYDLHDLPKEKAVQNASFHEVPWLVYDFPLPSHLRIKYDMQDPDDLIAMKKLPIFIVNFQKCNEFLESLKTYFEKLKKEILHSTESYI